MPREVAYIASTDVPAFELAADTPLQADGHGDLVTWNIVFNLGVKMTPRRASPGPDALVIHFPEGDVIATRLPEGHREIWRAQRE